VGGDEFCAVLADVESGDDVHAISERILHAVTRPLDLAGQTLAVSASIGVALGAGVLRRRRELIRRADMAMYRSKRSGKGRVTADRSARGAS
jgi:two-component system, sensor histidine kinase LadS